MPDTTFGWIRIGGTVLEKDVDELCEAISQSQLYAGYDGVPADGNATNPGTTFAPEDVDDLLEVAEDGWLVLSDADAIGGCFETLEDFCIDRGIEFDRFASTLYSYPPEAKKNRKDIGVVETTTNEDSDNVVNEQPVREALALIRQGKVNEGATMLDELISKDVPDLGPVIFKMNDGTKRTPIP